MLEQRWIRSMRWINSLLFTLPCQWQREQYYRSCYLEERKILLFKCLFMDMEQWDRKGCTFCTLLLFSTYKCCIQNAVTAWHVVTNLIKKESKSFMAPTSPYEGAAPWCPGQEMDFLVNFSPSAEVRIGKSVPAGCNSVLFWNRWLGLSYRDPICKEKKRGGNVLLVISPPSARRKPTDRPQLVQELGPCQPSLILPSIA